MKVVFLYIVWLSVVSVLAPGQVHAASNATPAVVTKSMQVVIPAPLSGYTVRNPFVEDLLVEIMASQQIDVEIIYSEQQYSQARAIKELSEGRGINLNWSVTSEHRESVLHAIKIPIYNNMVGWRVALIRKGEQYRFNQVASRYQLQQFKAVQKYDWPDYKVFQHNGLPVEGNLSFKQMTAALEQGLVDYFPRSVLEVYRESIEPRNNGLAIENKLLIKYPSAYYFFVNKSDLALAAVIEQGFKQIKDNGRYQQLFDRYYGSHLAPLQLSSRTIIELTNPDFPTL